MAEDSNTTDRAARQRTEGRTAQRRSDEPTEVVQLRVVDKPSPEARKISKDELRKLLSKTGGHVQSAVPTKGSAKRQARTRKLDEATFREYFAKDEELIKWVTQSGDHFPADGPQAKIKTRKGSRQVRLMQPRSLLRDMVMIKAQLDNPKYQVHHYGEMRATCERQMKRLSPDGQKQLTAVLRKLPEPTKVAETGIQNITATIQQLIDAILVIFGGHLVVQNPTAPASCELEEGTGFGGDSGGTITASDINPDGLMATNDWPLKRFSTCVRDQGGRGTCTAFGIVAAVEARVAAQHGRWMNLSEQDLYMHQKLHWFPIPPDWYGDGYNAVYSTILQTLAINYTFPFEVSWDYNKSTDRNEFDVQREYTDSCTLYNGEACSDTNHQAELVDCYGIPETEILEEDVEVCGWNEVPLSEQTGIGGIFGSALDWVQNAAEWVCETVTEVTEVVTGFLELCVYDTDIAGTSGIRITGSAPLWVKDLTNAGNWSGVKAHLDLLHPVIFCYNVVDSFNDNDGGYVAYDPNEDTAGGGHCSVITGYVDNADLPAGAPDGAGGGYFVVKNSWGVDSGDQGYYYVPYDWTRRFGKAMVAITAVS